MRSLSSFVAGALFGLGLVLAGMTDTRKVQGWLDVFGDWNPTLAFVMGGAMIPMAIAWRLTRGRRPLLGGLFPPAADTRVGPNLIAGSILFGMGWALSGLCPGPSIASLSFGGVGGVVFLVAMLAGMIAAPHARRRLDALAAQG